MIRPAQTKLKYLTEIYTDRPGSQTIHAFNRSLSLAGVTGVTHQPSGYWTNVARRLDNGGFLRSVFTLPGTAFIVALMWPKVARLFPTGYFREIIPLCFDCWPEDFDKWEKIFRRHRINTAFFTARQSCEYFKSQIPAMNCFWLPEAADPGEYPFTKNLVDREIDVLELGRRHTTYHENIRPELAKKKVVHLYKGDDGKRLFATREQLMQAWGDTKISICFPKSATDTQKSGGLETVTFRYFESIASRCLIVGQCPAELKDLFGYNPVIKVDQQDPAGQLTDLLINIESHQCLVERNHKRMLEVGSWNARVESMLNSLEAIGYRR